LLGKRVYSIAEGIRWRCDVGAGSGTDAMYGLCVLFWCGVDDDEAAVDRGNCRRHQETFRRPW